MNADYAHPIDHGVAKGRVCTSYLELGCFENLYLIDKFYSEC